MFLIFVFQQNDIACSYVVSIVEPQYATIHLQVGYTICPRVAYCVGFVHMLFHWSFEGTQYAQPEKKIIAFLARRLEVLKAIVVTSTIRFPIQIHVPFTQRQSFPEVHILTTTYQKAFVLGPETTCMIGFHSMNPDPTVHARWGWD